MVVRGWRGKEGNLQKDFTLVEANHLTLARGKPCVAVAAQPLSGIRVM
jgi:hypothetical protein